MKKQYITNKAGERIFPYTHLKAVLDDNGNDLDSVLGTYGDAIDDIEDLIPNAADENNLLADKAFVNSSIATNTATFRGCYHVVDSLNLTYNATLVLIAAALATTMAAATPDPIVPDNNDYCFVEIPADGTTSAPIGQVDKYKYDGTAWSREYTLNNSGYTSVQWLAINSGITASNVTKLNSAVTSSEISTIWVGSQQDYDDIASKDTHTEYNIV